MKRLLAILGSVLISGLILAGTAIPAVITRLQQIENSFVCIPAMNSRSFIQSFALVFLVERIIPEAEEQNREGRHGARLEG